MLLPLRLRVHIVPLISAILWTIVWHEPENSVPFTEHEEYYDKVSVLTAEREVEVCREFQKQVKLGPYFQIGKKRVTHT